MAPARKNIVNNQIYEEYGEKWYSAYDDPVALLRAESKLKNAWIVERINNNFQNPKVLDVGCGAGFISNYLAKSGYEVTGIDLSPESIRVAKKHDETKSVHYEIADAYKIPYPNATFDVVTAMDFLEHVDNPELVIQEVSRVLKPGGMFFFNTFNRNPISHFLAIKCIQWFVRNVPKDMHVIKLFLKPKEVREFCEKNGMIIKEIVGLNFDFSTIPLKNYFTGIVPESLEFRITKSTLLCYLGYAKKNKEGDFSPSL